MASGYINLPVEGGSGGPVDAADVTYSPAVPGNWNPAPDDAQEALDQLAARGALRLVLTTDQSNTGDDSNITTIADFTFAALADSLYLCEYFLNIHSTAQAVVRIKPSYPANVVSVYGGMGGTQGSGDAQTSQPPSNGTQITQYISTQAGDYSLGTFTMLVNTDDAGNVTFGFSGANGATPTLIKAASFARITKLS